jgi:hypothetical protein
MNSLRPVVGVVSTSVEWAVGASPVLIVVTAAVWLIGTLLAPAIEYHLGKEARAVKAATALIKGGFTCQEATTLTTILIEHAQCPSSGERECRQLKQSELPAEQLRQC